MSPPASTLPLTSLITDEAPPFLSNLLRTLKSTYPHLIPFLRTAVCDHICLRVASEEEYLRRKQEFQDLGSDLLTETPVGGRLIATYKLPKQYAIEVEDGDYLGLPNGREKAEWVEERFGKTGRRMVDVVELPAPKKGAKYESGWEHVEFSLGLGDFEAGIKTGAVEGSSWMDMGVRRLVEMGEEKRVEEAMEALAEFERQVQEAQLRLNSSGSNEGKGITWDKGGMKKPGFNVDLRIEFEGFSVKFHWMPLEVVIGVENVDETAEK
ncbi:hypothetical protein HDV05_000472 [Chytridiales sp. JEL 0842]|nr:hypothetical protein HDV05_000472 [Chytridiales sp. JEL 0842]